MSSAGDLAERRRCYQLYRERMQHEDSLIGARISWLMASQSFLFSPFVLLNNDPRFFSRPMTDTSVRDAQSSVYQQLGQEAQATKAATQRVQQDGDRVAQMVAAAGTHGASPAAAATLKSAQQTARQDTAALQSAQQAEALTRAVTPPPPTGVEPAVMAFSISLSISLLIALIGAVASLASLRSVQAAIRSMSCLCLEFIGKFPQDNSYEPGISVSRNQGVHGLVTARRMPPLFFGIWMALIGLTLGMHVGSWLGWGGWTLAGFVGAFVLLLGLISLWGYARFVWAERVEEKYTNDCIAMVQHLRRQSRTGPSCPAVEVWPYPQKADAAEVEQLLCLYTGAHGDEIQSLPKESGKEGGTRKPWAEAALNAADFEALHHAVFLAASAEGRAQPPVQTPVKRLRRAVKLRFLGKQVRFEDRLDFLVTPANPKAVPSQYSFWPLVTNHVLVVWNAAPWAEPDAASPPRQDDTPAAPPADAEPAPDLCLDVETFVQETVGVDNPSG